MLPLKVCLSLFVSSSLLLGWAKGNLFANLIRAQFSPERCYDGWGCFPQFETSKELSAPLSWVLLHPDAPEDIDVHFFVFDCYRPSGEVVRYNASDQVLRNLTYEGNKQTILIVHGSNDQYGDKSWTGVSLH